MYNVSSATLAAIENFNLQARITGTVNGVAFTDANIVGGSFSINNQCSSDTELTIGNVYVGELNITLTGLSLDRYSLYGKLIIPTYGLYVNNAWVPIPLGEYIISEVEVTNVGIDIRAYDNMSKFDVPFELVSLSGTAYALASAACTACGLTLATTQTQFNAFTNHGVTFTATQTDGKIPQFSTYRDVISAIAQVSCCNVLIDRSGQVVFKPYPSTAVATIDTAHRKMGGMTADFETYYDSIIVTDPTTKAQTKYTRSNPTGLTMDLGDNPFINTAAIRNAILNALTFRFHPFRMDILNAPLYDLMDCINLPDGIGDGTKLYCITKYTWTYHGSYALVGAGQDPKLVAVASAAQRSAAQANFIAAQKVTTDEMDAAIESATAQITGNNGGYVVLHDSDNDDQPDELLVMNTPSISTATKVWRFNLSGLGHSNNGYSGTYGLALTADGAIVADRITVGTLNGDIIKAGSLQSVNYNATTHQGFSLNLLTGDADINITGTVESIQTFYAESLYNSPPQWDYPTAYLYDKDGKALYDANGNRLVAKRTWTTTVPTSDSPYYRWMRNLITYKDGTTQLTSATPMQDYYGRANLVFQASEDANGNPIGIISSLADYISFTAGQLEIKSPQFTLDREGNATFAGNLSAATGSFDGEVVATSLTLGSLVSGGSFRLLSPDGFTDVNLSGDSNGSYISVTDTTSYARSTLRGQAGSLILSLSSDNGSTYTEIGSLWVNAGTGRSVANIDTIQVGRYHAVTTGNLGNNQQIARWDYTENKAYVYSNEFRLRQSDGSASYVLADWDNTNSRVDVYGGLFAVRSSNSLLTFAVWDSSNSRAELRSDIFRLRNNSTLYTMLSWDSTQTTPGTKVTASYGSITNVDATKLTAGSYWGSNGEVIHYINTNNQNILRAVTFQAGTESANQTVIYYDSATSMVNLRAGLFQIRNGGALYNVLSWDSTNNGSKISTGYGSITDLTSTKITENSLWGSNGEVIHYTSSNSNNLLRAYQYQIGNEADHATFATYSSGVISLNAGIVYGSSYVYSPALKIYDSANSAIKNFAQWNTSDGIVVNADKLYLNDTTAVGTVKSASSTLTSLPSGTTTNLCSVSLTKGIWVVTGQVTCTGSGSFRMVGAISTLSADYQFTSGGYCIAAVTSSLPMIGLTPVRIIEVTAASQTVYLVANQNSGSDKAMTSGRSSIRAVCIA